MRVVEIHREGHLGFTFLIFSSLILLLNIASEVAIAVTVFAGGLSSIPDWDLDWEKMRHRTYTHSILFAVVAGALFGLLTHYGGVGWVVGFLAGFGGVSCHLLGDLLTHMPFKPLWPISHTKKALHLFYSNNDNVNRGMLYIGLIPFILVSAQYSGVL